MQNDGNYRPVLLWDCLQPTRLETAQNNPRWLRQYVLKTSAVEYTAPRKKPTRKKLDVNNCLPAVSSISKSPSPAVAAFPASKQE
jgi:hypothetical protein